MPKITEQMVRSRAEHNELEISTLEEVSLHQQDIERIEHIEHWCRELKILYLQSNLIPKIENVGKLKKLEYLNLALNNVEKIENLEGCESLQKLDLTVNFVGELTSIESLKDNYNLRELFLTGNPCTDFDGYKNYVMATLPQLKWLDGIAIEKSEKITAIQELEFIRPGILEQEENYRKKRLRQKEESNRKKELEERKKDPGFDGRWYTDLSEEDKVVKEEKSEEEQLKEFWDEKVEFTPESRQDVHEHMQKVKNKKEQKDEVEEKKPREMFASDGRPYNINETKVDFTLTEDEENGTIVLDLSCFKHMDTSLLDCDVQINYVRVILKGKIFQLCLPEDVNPDSSTAQRSEITGHLLVTMPKAKQLIKKKTKSTDASNKENSTMSDKKTSQRSESVLLEVDASARSCPDIGNIVKAKSEKTAAPLGHKSRRHVKERPNSEGFVDDLDVPPLM